MYPRYPPDVPVQFPRRSGISVTIGVTTVVLGSVAAGVTACVEIGVAVGVTAGVVVGVVHPAIRIHARHRHTNNTMNSCFIFITRSLVLLNLTM